MALLDGALHFNQHSPRLRPEHRRVISFRPAVCPRSGGLVYPNLATDADRHEVVEFRKGRTR